MYTYFRKPFPRNAHTEKLLVKIRAAAEDISISRSKRFPTPGSSCFRRPEAA